MSETIQPVSGYQYDTTPLSVIALCNMVNIDPMDLGIPDGLVNEPATNFMEPNEIITILEGN